jgi:uncharacterized protein (TIGR02271 family)
MTDTTQWTVQPGTDVYGSDGEKVGEVDDIQNGHLVIRKGFFFPKDHYVPFSAIAGHTDDRIDLNVTGDQAKNEQWGDVTTGTSAVGYDTTPLSESTTTDAYATTDTYATDANATAPRGGDVVARDEAPIEHVNRGAAHAHDEDEIAVPVVEEQLEATRRGVERGQVHIETRVSEAEQTLEVPVTEERVRVDRVTVDREATAADLSRDGATIDVPVYGEEVELDKRARVVEEVRVSKDAVQDSRTVSGTVRREDVEVVDGTTDVTDGTTGTGGTRRS